MCEALQINKIMGNGGCYKVQSYGYNPLQNGACEKHDQHHRHVRFPVNKARVLKPSYTVFVFSLYHATLHFST